MDLGRPGDNGNQGAVCPWGRLVMRCRRPGWRVTVAIAGAVARTAMAGVAVKDACRRPITVGYEVGPRQRATAASAALALVPLWYHSYRGRTRMRATTPLCGRPRNGEFAGLVPLSRDCGLTVAAS
jgi:hypothetical protein